MMSFRHNTYLPQPSLPDKCNPWLRFGETRLSTFTFHGVEPQIELVKLTEVKLDLAAEIVEI